MAKSSTTWKKGQTGNPGGKKKGTGKVSQLRALLDPHAEDLVNKAKDMALGGDMTALRLCLERLVPPIKIKDEPVTVEGMDGSKSLVEQGQAIINALAKGGVTPSEAATLMQSVSNQARILEVDELERRITTLESKHGN
jgi:hypothetical protein